MKGRQMKGDVLYPPEIPRKVLKLEGPGGLPASVELTIPTMTSQNRSFDVKVAVLDSIGYPSLECNADVRVFLPEQDTACGSISFSRGEPAVGTLRNLTFDKEGVYRVRATYEGIEGFSNPCLCRENAEEGVFWGDPHVHTILSNCHADRCRSLNFCYAAARYCTCLDWVAAADHVSNGRCDFSKWKEQSTVSNLYNDEPEFVTIPAYEASLQGGAGGDNNVYMSCWPEMFVDEYEEGDVRILCDRLAEKLSPGEFFVVPHHTTRTGKHGEISDDIYPGRDRMPVVEIHSKWGTSEFRGNANALHKIHPGPSYVVDLLNRGLRLGLIAGTDTHATMPSGGGDDAPHIDRLPGITAVRCKKLTRQGVFDGIHARNCYAASFERVLIDGQVVGLDFGQEVACGNLDARRTDLTVAGRSDVLKIELVRNGEVIHCEEPGIWRTRFTHEDADQLDSLWLTSRNGSRFVYYYVRVTCSSGAQAWTSPVWISG